MRNPVVITLLYVKGAILASKKTSYAHIINEPDYKEKLKRIMREQHKSMINDLLSGKYTGEYKEDETEQVNGKQLKTEDRKGQISQSLDDILLDYIIKRK